MKNCIFFWLNGNERPNANQEIIEQTRRLLFIERLTKSVNKFGISRCRFTNRWISVWPFIGNGSIQRRTHMSLSQNIQLIRHILTAVVVFVYSFFSISRHKTNTFAHLTGDIVYLCALCDPFRFDRDGGGIKCSTVYIPIYVL